jgi:nitrogen fixation/metabolism regulation signal transduction histidine kinase
MGVQHRFRAAWVVATTAVIALSSAALFLILRSVLSRDLGTQFSRAFFVMEQARGALWVAVGFSLLAYAALVSVLVIAVAVYLSHHIAWPLHRLERFAEGLGRGDLRSSFHLRRHDQLQELTQALDEFRDHAAHRQRAVHHAVERIERRWADLGACDAAGHDREEEKLLDFLAGEVELIRTHLRQDPSGPAR